MVLVKLLTKFPKPFAYQTIALYDGINESIKKSKAIKTQLDCAYKERILV